MKPPKALFILLFTLGTSLCLLLSAQSRMTPELLWQIGRVSGETLTPDGQNVIYGIAYYDVKANKGTSNLYTVPVSGGKPRQLTSLTSTASNVQFSPSGKFGYLSKGFWYEADADGSDPVQLTNDSDGIDNVKYSPDGKWVLFTRSVKLDKTIADRYPGLPKAKAKIMDNLMYRHWVFWEDGSYSHVFYAPYTPGKIDMDHAVDIMKDEPYYCPQQPDGGAEDIIWSPDSKNIVYVCKKKVGKEYTVSTNSDIYFYDLATGITTDFTQDNPGYDTYPVFSPDHNKIAWLSMARDGYESDKNRIMLYDFKTKIKYELTKGWDESATSLEWCRDSNTKGNPMELYFLEDAFGTDQLFNIDIPTNTKEQEEIATHPDKYIHQVTEGDFDITSILGETGHGNIIVTRTDMNHAAEIFSVVTGHKELSKTKASSKNETTPRNRGYCNQLTFTNKNLYDSIHIGAIEKRWVNTTDGKKELVWVIYPPDFDAKRKYPTLLYCQGGPQSSLSQFYSFRWNFQLMAAYDYIIVAPCRRGMPGFGIAWNQEISRDWGGQCMNDYLSAIDSISKLPFVDISRRGAIGASFGGYSIYFLEGIHNGRFKTFIAHDGVFDLESMYGTTDEMWFPNWEFGGPYWKDNPSFDYKKFNPKNYVDKWNTPILIIHGQEDFRVPVEQGMEAFQAAQLKGIKSRFLYFEDEGHWVLRPQDGLLWQHEFFRWLAETLPRVPYRKF